MALADDLYTQRIFIASARKVVVEAIKEESSACFGAIVHEIIDRSTAFISCSFNHEF